MARYQKFKKNIFRPFSSSTLRRLLLRGDDDPADAVRENIGPAPPPHPNPAGGRPTHDDGRDILINNEDLDADKDIDVQWLTEEFWKIAIFKPPISRRTIKNIWFIVI